MDAPSRASLPVFSLRQAAWMGSAVAAGLAPLQAQEAAQPINGNEPVDLPPEEVNGGEQIQLKTPKFTAPLRDVPQLVTVIPAEVMELQAASSLRDVLRNSPGITFQAGEGGNAPGDSLFIRGFAARGDIFVNGFRDNAQYSRDAFNLEQVEVAKGPSSSIGGRGTTGGAVNLVTKQPYQSNGGSVSAAYGTAEQKRVTLDANQVVDRDTGTAVRVNAMWTEGGVPGRDVVENSRWGIAPSVAFGLGQKTQAVLTYQHNEQDNIPDYGQPGAAALNQDVDRENFYGLVNRDFEEIESDQGTLELVHRITQGMTLRNTTHYDLTTRNSIVTAPRFVTGSTTEVRRTDVKYQDREFETFGNQTNLQWELDTGSVSHSISAGLDLIREVYTNHGRLITPGAGYPLTTDLYNPDPYQPYEGTYVRTGAYTEGTGDTVAVYAFDSVKLSDSWQLTGGLRYENFDAKSEAKDTSGNLTEITKDDTMLSWRGALLYKPSLPITYYVGASTSFNPSAESLTLSTAGTAANNPNLDPEETRSYEAGVKWEPTGKGYMLSAAVFRTEKTNARTRATTTDTYVLEGEQVVQGIEFSATGQITDDWSVLAGYAFMESEITASQNDLEEGHALPYAPEHAFTLWTTYQVSQKLQLGAGAQYTGSYYYSTTAADSTVPEGTEYWLFNAMASYQVTDDLALRLNVENIADEEYIERGYGGHFTPGRSRSFLLTATYRY